MSDEVHPGGEWLFARLPDEVVGTLTPDQTRALNEAADGSRWSSHPVNIRFGVPLPGRRFFVTIIGGVEKRHPERRARERHRYPLRTLANIFFFVGAAVAFYAAALVVLAFVTSVVEF